MFSILSSQKPYRHIAAVGTLLTHNCLERPPDVLFKLWSGTAYGYAASLAQSVFGEANSQSN
jgi:hypothetical protein